MSWLVEAIRYHEWRGTGADVLAEVEEYLSARLAVDGVTQTVCQAQILRDYQDWRDVNERPGVARDRFAETLRRLMHDRATDGSQYGPWKLRPVGWRPLIELSNEVQEIVWDHYASLNSERSKNKDRRGSATVHHPDSKAFQIEVKAAGNDVGQCAPVWGACYAMARSLRAFASMSWGTVLGVEIDLEGRTELKPWSTAAVAKAAQQVYAQYRSAEIRAEKELVALRARDARAFDRSIGLWQAVVEARFGDDWIESPWGFAGDGWLEEPVLPAKVEKARPRTELIIVTKEEGQKLAKRKANYQRMYVEKIKQMEPDAAARATEDEIELHAGLLAMIITRDEASYTLKTLPYEHRLGEQVVIDLIDADDKRRQGLSVAEFQDAVRRMERRDQCVIGNCYAPKKDRVAVVERLWEALERQPARIGSFEHVWGTHRVRGFALKFGRYQTLVQVPEAADDSKFPDWKPQVVIQIPRSDGEAELLFELMRDNQLVLQPSTRQKHWVFPTTVPLKATLRSDVPRDPKDQLAYLKQNSIVVRSSAELLAAFRKV